MIGRRISGSRILKDSSNRLFRRVVGKGLFRADEKDTRVQGTVGDGFEDFLERGRREKSETWSLAREFTLVGREDWEPFPLILKTGQAVRGYVDAEEGVWTSMLTASSFSSFEREDGFRSLWNVVGDFVRVDFVSERTGIYYLVVANFDLGDSSRFCGEDESVFVELRLRF